MTKGKPWPVEDERTLREQVQAGVDLDGLVACFGNKYTRNAVYQKMADLGLKAEEKTTHYDTPSSKGAKLTLPEELPSLEESLKTFNAASTALHAPNLSRTDVIRLGKIIQAEKIYQEQFPKYVKYRELENEVMELRKKLAEKTNKDKA